MLVATAVLGGSCGSPDEGPWPIAEEGKSDGLFATRAEYFAPDNFYCVRAKKWDARKTTPAALAEEVEVAGAELYVYLCDPTSSVHCESTNVPAAERVHKTTSFSLRTSGNLTNGTPKSSYKVKFTAKSDRLLKMTALNLKSMWNDVSQMRERLAWTLFGAIGVPAPRHVYSKFCIDNKYFGLYSQVQQVDGSFLKDHFGASDQGNLYKAYWADIGPADLGYRQGSDGDDGGRQYFTARSIDDRSYQLKSNESPDDDPAFQTYDDLATFIRVTNGVTTPGGEEKFNTAEYRQAVESIFDVWTFLRWASLNALIGAWDNYWQTPANYYLYNSGKRGGEAQFMAHPYFHWIPWDYDNTFGIDFFGKAWQHASITDWEEITGKRQLQLVRHLLRNDDFLAYYLDHMEWLLDTHFNVDWVDEQIGREGGGGIWDQVRQAAYLESDGTRLPPHTGRQFTNDQVYWNGFQHHELQQGSEHVFGIHHFVNMRNDNVRAQLAELRRRIPRGSSGAAFPAEPGPLPDVPQ